MISKLTKESWTPDETWADTEWGWGKTWAESWTEGWAESWAGNSERGWGKSWGSNCKGSWSSDTEWGSAIGWGRGSVDGLTRVLDVSNVAGGWVRGVGHSLETTVGKVDVVLSLCGITIAVFSGTKVGSAEAVSNSVRVVVGWGNVRVDWSSNSKWSWSISWSWNCILGSSCGSSDESKQSNEALKGYK